MEGEEVDDPPVEANPAGFRLASAQVPELGAGEDELSAEGGLGVAVEEVGEVGPVEVAEITGVVGSGEAGRTFGHGGELDSQFVEDIPQRTPLMTLTIRIDIRPWLWRSTTTV